MESFDFVILVDHDYEFWISLQRELPVLLTPRSRVLVVERPITLLHLSKRSRWPKVARWKQGVHCIKQNLYLTCPPPILPLQSRVWLAEWINRQVLSNHIRNAMNELGLHRPILVLFGLNYYWAIEDIAHSLSCYRCADAYYAFPGVPARWAMGAERRLLSGVDIVFAASEKLRATLSEGHPTVYHLSNGVDYDLFSKATLEETSVPDDIACIPTPIIGVIGSLDENLDLDLLLHLVTTYPTWSFVFIGPTSTRPLGYFTGFQQKLGELHRYPNVHFLGQRPHEVLPGYLKAFSAGIIAYKLDLAGVSRDPVKAYEYLAAGKPVVSVDIPALRAFNGLVRIAKSPQEFGCHLEACLVEDNAEQVKQRQAFAQLHSCESKVETMMTILGGYLEKGR